jgi:tight adherence protein C
MLIPLMVFGAVALLGIVAVIALSPQENILKIRLESLSASGAGVGPTRGRAKGKTPKKENFFGMLSKKMGHAAKSIFEGAGDETSDRLAMAGFNPQTYLSTFNGARVMAGLGLATFGVLFMLLSGASVGKMVLTAFGGFISGMLFPSLWLSMQIRGRREKISSSLPNMVDLLVVCVEAGLGLDAAMLRVGQELALSAPELSQELGQLGRELTGGQSHEQALTRLARRIGIEDVENLVSMLIQAERFGTSIAVSLRVFSDSFRTARRQRVEEAAAKTTVKLLFPLVFFIFPAIFVILLGPSVVNFMSGGGLK